MTKDQILEMVSLRLDGATYQEIADKFGVSCEWISQNMPPKLKGRKQPLGEVVYPTLREWMEARKLSISSFADEFGLPYSTVYRFLIGVGDPRKNTIDKILEVTGLTYEQAFKREE